MPLPCVPGTAAKRLLAEDRARGDLPAPAGNLQPVASSALSRLVDPALPDADRGAHLRVLGRGQCHPVVLSVYRTAADGDASRLSFAGHVQRGAATAARLPAQQQRFRDPQPAVSGQRAGTWADPVVRHAADYVDGNFPAAGGRAEQHLGIQEEPLVPDEPSRVAGPGTGLRMPGHAVDRADGAEPAAAGTICGRSELRFSGRSASW